MFLFVTSQLGMVLLLGIVLDYEVTCKQTLAWMLFKFHCFKVITKYSAEIGYYYTHTPCVLGN